MIEQRAAELAGKTADTLTTATKITAGGTLLAGLTVEQWTSICGLIAAIVGILATIIVSGVTCYYRRKEYQLKKARAAHDGVAVEKEEDDDDDEQ